MDAPTLPKSTLYLREDGTLLLVNGSQTVEMALTPTMLLQLGMDALSIATRLKPDCLHEALQALESTLIEPAALAGAHAHSRVN